MSSSKINILYLPRLFFASHHVHPKPKSSPHLSPPLPRHVLLPTRPPHLAVPHLAYSFRITGSLTPCNHAEPGARCHQVFCGEAAAGQVHLPGWPVRSLLMPRLPRVFPPFLWWWLFCSCPRLVGERECWDCWLVIPLGSAQAVCRDHWRKGPSRPLGDGVAWSALAKGWDVVVCRASWLLAILCSCCVSFRPVAH